MQPRIFDTLQLAIAIFVCGFLGCSGAEDIAPTPNTQPAATVNLDAPLPGSGQRASISSADCIAQGGTVVGDIGNGAIHSADYVCPTSNKPPLGTIKSADGEPIGVEGAVCCPSE